MRKVFLVLIPLIGLAFPTFAMAEVSVNIQNDNNSSTTTQQSSSSVTTDVRIETNGEVKEFHTEGNEDVDWTSDDGKSSVKINSNTSSKSNVSQDSDTSVNTNVNATVKGAGTVKVETNTEASDSDSTKDISEKIEKEKENLFAVLKKELESINNFFSNLFANILH